MRRAFDRVMDGMRIPLLALASVGLAYLAYIGFDGSLASFDRPQLPPLERAQLGQRLLVIAPHPDDEALAAAGLLHDSIHDGRMVRVVLVTCGDGYRRIVGRYGRSGPRTPPSYVHLGDVRAAESRAALGVLGLPAGDETFLGYPDGSISSLWGTNWSGTPLRGTNGETEVPYRFALRPGARYTGTDLASDLASVVAAFQPSAVVFPDGEDSNADHWAVNALMQYALDGVGFTGGRYTYLVHRGHFPFPWSYLPKAWVEPPRTLTNVGDRWVSYQLEASTVAIKGQALDSYRSQRAVMEPFLAAFVRRNELFATTSTPRLAVAQSAPATDAPTLPGAVTRDPSGDTLLRLLDAGADVRQVALVRTPQGVWAGVRMQEPVSPGAVVRLHARVLDPEGTTDLQVESRGRSARLLVPGVRGGSGIASHLAGRSLWVQLPSEPFARPGVCLLSVETLAGGAVLDRTPVRAVTLP